MRDSVAPGVWPTMLTPFDVNGDVDHDALDALVDWYLSKGVAGLFAVCQSSEMFALSLAERTEIARRVVGRVADGCGVIASGHTSDDPHTQVQEIEAMASTGVDAVVLVTNRLAAADEGDAVWIRTAEELLDQLPPTLPLGLYECPYPYKRLLSEKLFRWVVESGRFSFLKDTCCDRTIQESRGRIAAGSRLRLFNANSATLLSSISCGYVGYSGVMANFHPELYTGLFGEAPKPELDAFLGVASLVEAHGYPLNAKEYLRRRGLPIEPIVRLGESRLLDAWSAELDKINTLTEHFRPVAKS